MAARAQVVGPGDPPRAGPPRARRVAGDGGPLAGAVGHQPAPGHRPRRVTQPQAGADRHPLSGSLGPPRRQESRTDPRRWRLARPRPGLRGGQGSPARQVLMGPGRLRLPALSDRRVLPAGLHRAPGRREGIHHDRVLPPRPNIPRRPRHQPPGEVGHRQRRQRQVDRVHPHRDRHRLTPPAHLPAHPRHNGKVERYNPILAEELLYARIWTCEADRAAAIKIWNIHYNCHRPHTAVGDQPPAPRLHARLTNVMSQNRYSPGSRATPRTSSPGMWPPNARS
jgi:integrase-like protein